MAKLSNPSVSDEEIVRAYQEHLSAYKVADLLKISNKRVYRVLGKAGVKPTGLQHYREGAEYHSRETQMEIAQLYAAGASTPKLAKQFGGSEYAITRAILRSGGTMRPGGGQKPRKFLDAEETAEVCRMYKSGMSQTAISGAIGVGQAVVSRVLRNTGVKVRGEREGRGKWLGGRMKAGPYVRVWVAPDDPFASMRDRAGYVLEHRLVMAHALGRPLHKSESVHHIDGNHAHNTIENLQLRQGQHGAGIVVRCLDCGSQKVGPAEIGEALSATHYGVVAPSFTVRSWWIPLFSITTVIQGDDRVDVTTLLSTLGPFDDDEFEARVAELEQSQVRKY